MKRTKAAESFARLSTVLNLLHAHPAGLRVDYLAAEIGIPEKLLRQELLTYYGADTLAVRPDTIMFVSPGGEEDDPASAEIVKVVSDRPAAELGVELMSDVQPDNEALTQAVTIIGERILSGTAPRPDTEIGRVISTAVQQHRLVDLEYSRVWKPGVVQRRVEPLRLVQTGRGWELDALHDGEMRTFLLERVRSATATSEEFTPPPDAAQRLAAHRAVTTLELNVPQRFAWVVDRYAEHSQVITQDEADCTIRADFLPPVPERIGLILVTAPGAFVLEPNELNDAGPAMARRLWEHHGL